MAGGVITVYAGGKIQAGREGQRAGDFGNTSTHDLVISNGTSLRFVAADYALQAGDSLTVAPKGVAGN